MDTETLARFQSALQARLAEIADADAATRASRATVALDQQSVGRLSRMDALQQQAMANATHNRRRQEAQRIAAALARIAQDGFGTCLDCGDQIEQQRLEFDPAIALCITCARG